MAQVIYSYVIVRNMFGNLWVGKSLQKADGIKFHPSHEQAVIIAMQYFEENHPEYNPEGDPEDLEYELLEEYDAIQGTYEIEQVGKGLYKFII